eukprot:gene13701-biopygen9585
MGKTSLFRIPCTSSSPGRRHARLLGEQEPGGLGGGAGTPHRGARSPNCLRRIFEKFGRQPSQRRRHAAPGDDTWL